MEEMVKWRKEIDEINSKIIQLLGRRTIVVRKVGKYKKENNIPITDTKREEIIFGKMEKLAGKNNVNKELVRDIFERIIKQAKVDEK